MNEPHCHCTECGNEMPLWRWTLIFKECTDCEQKRWERDEKSKADLLRRGS